MAQDLELSYLSKAITSLTTEMKNPKKEKKNSEQKSKDTKEDRGEKRFQNAMLDTLMAIKGKLILSNDQLKKIGMDLAKTLKSFAAGIIRKPIEAAKGIFSAIGEFLKLGALLLGGIEFIKGWEKAALWFGENADVWDRISAGFANILKALGFTDDVEQTALGISIRMHWIVDKLKKAFGDVFDAIKKTIKSFQEDGFLAAAKTLGSNIFESKEAMILLGVLFGGKILGGLMAAVSAAGTLIPLLVTMTFRIGFLLFNAVKAISTSLLAAVTAFGPALLIAAAIAVAVAALVWVLQDLQSENSKIKAAWEWVKEKVTAIVDIVQNGIANAIDHVKDGLADAWLAITKVGNDIYTIAATAVDSVKDSIKTAFDKVMSIGTDVKDWFDKTLQSVLLDIYMAWDILSTIGTRLKTAITDAVNSAMETAFGGVQVVLEFGSLIVDKVSEAVNKIINKAFDLGTNLTTAALDLKDSLIDNVVSFASKITDTFSAIFSTLAALINPKTLFKIATTDLTVGDVFQEQLEKKSTDSTNKSDIVDSGMINTTGAHKTAKVNEIEIDSAELRDLQNSGTGSGSMGSHIQQVNTDNSSTSNNTIVHPAHTKPGVSEGYTKTNYSGFKITDLWKK